MKKYRVTLYYHTSATVEVETNKTYNHYIIEEAKKMITNEMILDNLQYDDDPDIEPIND